MSGSRAPRVADEVRRILARQLHEKLRDPRIGFVTLTEVRMSADLRQAVAYFTVVEPERREETLHGLTRAAAFLRRAVAREAGLRFAPYLRFVYDDVGDGAQRVERILAGERREREEREEPPNDS